MARARQRQNYTPPDPLDGLRSFELPGGWQLLVGKTSADNERLSLRVVDANDYWFHIRGATGSHVVLREQSAPRSRFGRGEPAR